VIVHSAGIQDRVAARAVLMRLFCRFDSIRKVFVDGGYTGKLIAWAKERFGYNPEVVPRNQLHTFQVLPKRWVVERSFAWFNWSRRLSKDYELLHTSAETIIHIAFAHLLLRRSPSFLDRFLEVEDKQLKNCARSSVVVCSALILSPSVVIERRSQPNIYPKMLPSSRIIHIL